VLDFYLGYAMAQQSATRAASLARSAAAADGTRHSNRIEDLNERVDRLVMILRATLALLEEQGITPERLMAKIEELDLQDGTDDGQLREGVVDCPSCESKVAPGLRRCQFCGTEVRAEDGHPIDSI
jgi:predicted HAD superfamily Cof-like phosphohydrolase